MSIQSQLNLDAISLFPKLCDIIESSDTHNASQIKSILIRLICESNKPVSMMNATELNLFEGRAIQALKHKEYIDKD